MIKTIEAVIQKLAQVKRAPMPAPAKQLKANWQSGFETGGHLQRKLRLVFAVPAHHSV